MNLRGILLTAGLLVTGLGWTASARAADNEFKIGQVESLSGPFSAAAHDETVGIDAWVKARGIPGKKVVFSTLDDETNPISASNTFRKLATDPDIKIIYLLTNSNSAMAIKPFASEFKIPLIAGGAVESIAVPPDPWMFKIPPGTKDQMTVLVRYMQKHGMKRLAVVHATDALGQAEGKNLHDLGPQYGVQIVADETFAVEDTNFTAQFTRVKAAQPDFVFTDANGRTGILQFKLYKQMSIPAPLAMGQSAASKVFYDGIGGADQADGLLLPTQVGALGDALGGDSAKLYQELAKTMGRAPIYLNTFGYDLGLITEAAFKASDGSRQGIRDALEKMKDLPGVNGPVTFTSTDHTGQDYRSLAMAKLKGGLLTPAD